MKAIRNWKVQSINQDNNMVIVKSNKWTKGGLAKLDDFKYSARLTTPYELKVLKKMAEDERESQYEDAICETQSIICDYWQGDLTGSQVNDEISSLWAQFGEQGQHDKREDKQ
jgi:hypothetical protein